MTRLAIICFDGVTDLDVFLHWDILNRPRTMFPVAGEVWEVHLLGRADTHQTQAGLSLGMHGLIDESAHYDAVIHSSGRLTRELMHDQAYLRTLSLDCSRQIVASQCSGALVLAASGCLNGLSATTYPTAKADLESFGIEYCMQPLVAHDRVATAAGCLAGLALDEWLLSHFLPSSRVTECLISAAPWGDGLQAITSDQ